MFSGHVQDDGGLLHHGGCGDRVYLQPPGGSEHGRSTGLRCRTKQLIGQPYGRSSPGTRSRPHSVANSTKEQGTLLSTTATKNQPAKVEKHSGVDRQQTPRIFPSQYRVLGHGGGCRRQAFGPDIIGVWAPPCPIRPLPNGTLHEGNCPSPWVPRSRRGEGSLA